MATLREAKTLTLTPTADAEALYSPQNLAADRAGQIAGATQFGRGWESAGLGEQANSLWTDSVKARLEGDTQSADVLALQAQDLQQQAAEWAPTVKNFTDVKGLRSGLDWAGGALGNLRTSVAPALGGLAGAAAGAALAPLTGGVVNPATAGFAGAALAGYNSEMNEAVANAMNDPDIAAARTPEEIIRVGRLKGLGNSMLEALVPAMLGGKLVGQGAKRAVGAGAKGAAARIGQEAAIGGVGEFATETAQSLGGQTAQNYLGSRPLTDYDYQQAFNEGMSGLVGGGVMGGVGGTADVMYDRLGQGVDKAKEIKADPAQAAADMLAGAGKLGGTMAGKAAPVATKFVDWVTGSKNRTYDDLTNPSVPDEVVEPYAHEWATNVLATQKEHSADDVRAAAEYIRDIANPGALSIYRLKIEANRNENRQTKDYSNIADEIEKRVRGKTKSSKMRGTLVDDFGEQEGRDPSEDVLMDDFGNQTSGAVVPHGYQGRTFGDISYEVPATAPTGVQVSYGQDLARRAPPQWPTTPEPAVKTPAEMRATYEATKREDKPVSTEQTADIWRKQGVSEGLLSATTPITDEAQRRMAIATMGWVERGFKDVDGNVFVPESLIKQQGKNVGAFIKSAVSTAFKNGLIGHDVASQASTIVEMAEKQHADATAVFDTVKGAIPEYARKEYSRSDVLDQIIPMLRHVAKYGLSSDKAEAGRQEEALLKIFGTKEALAQAMSKFETPRGKNMLAQENDAEDVFDANELGKRAPGKTSDDEADARYESELATSAGETRYVGVDKDNTPFDTRDPKQFDKLTALAGDVSSGRVSRVVGLWQRIKDASQSEGDLREAESDLLLEHAKDFLQPSRLADIERYGVPMQEVVDTMPELQRRSILRKIDNRYKMIRLDNMGDAAAADAIPKGRTTEMIREAPKTIDQGGLFLEREAGGKVMKTPFATTAIRLIKHFLKSSEWDTISGSGLHGSYQAMLKSLAAVMETEVAHTEAVQAWYDDVRKDPDATPEVVDKAKAALDRAKAGGRFTGRIGYKTDLDGPVTWLPKGVGSRAPTKGDAAAQLATLPEVFKLGLKGSVDTGEGTLADAKKVATGALYSGDKGGALVPFETTFEGQVRALEELAARPTTSESFQWVIYNTLDGKPGQSERSWKKGIGSFYQKLRGWEDGEDNLFSAVSDLYAAPDVKAPKRGSLVDSEGAAGLLEWLLRTVPEGNKLDAKRAAADQTMVSTPEGKMPPARKVKIPDVIQEKIAAHTKAGRHSKALALREEWTKTFRDVAAWQIQNTEGRGSDSDTISVGDLTSDESALSMSRAEDPSMEDMTRPTTPFVPTYPVKWRKLLEMKDAGGVELTEDEVATLAELRRGAPAWNKSFNKLFETDPRKLTDSERKLVARLQGGTAAWRAKYGVPTRLKGTIERDDEGMALGLGDDAVGAGYGGGRSTNTGTEPVVFRRKGDKIVDQRTGTQFDAASNEPAGAPLATTETPGRATTRIDPIEEARDWAFDKLRQGLAAFVSSINSLSKERLEVLKLGVVALAKMRPDAVVKYMDRALTEQQVSTILSRAAKAARMMGATLDEGGADGQTVRVVGSGRGTSGVAGAGTQASAGDAVLEGSKPSATSKDSVGRPGPTGGGAAGAQGTGVTALVEQARPPAFAKAKEGAKAAGADLVFAPSGVAGSYASRLAAVAKAAGTLVDPKDKAPLAGKTVYVSVPGASRGFSDMPGFIADVKALLDRGAAVRADNAVNAFTTHNTAGEGALFNALRVAGYAYVKAPLYGEWKKAEAKPLLTERTVERRAQITRAMLKAEPDTLFLFGDNDDRRGLGGQAASMRGESNAVGVRTKAHPTTASDAFWSDSQLAENKRKIDEDLKRAFEHNGKVVIPSAGLGSGLARLDVTAPQTFAYLESRLKALEAKPEAKPPEVVPMNFYDGINFGGVLHRMRPEFKGRTTLDLIKSGDRTATSRRTRPSVSVGDVLAMTNKSGERVLVRVTKAPYKVSEVTPEQWSKLEGWDTSVYAPYKDAWQYQYELVEKSEPAAPTTLTAKITKQLADAKTTVDKTNVIFDELKTLLDNHTERGAFGVRLTNLKDDVKDVASYLEAMSTAEMSMRSDLTPAQAKALTEMLTKAYRAFQMAHGKSVVDVLEGTKPSSQTANRGPGRELYTEEEIAKAKKFITDRLGDSVKVDFVPYFGDNSSGSWTPTNTKSVIRLALNGDIFGTAAHESMHEFFALLGKAGSKQTQDILLRTATNKILLRKVERLLDGNPEAVKQINADPEEALAFMYQFWSAGLLKLGPETRTFFQKVKDYVAKVLGRLSKEMQDEVFVDKVFRAFDAGVLSKDGSYTKPALTDGTKRTGPEVMDGSIRDAMLRAFEQNSEAHEQALDAIDKKWRNVTRNVGKLGFSAEAMMLATGNKQIADIMSRFNQETGTAMRTVGGKVSQPYFQGVTQHNGVFMNRLGNILTAYSPEDIELARKAMATGRVATDRVAKEITEKIYALNDDLFDYITSRKVMRLDDMAHNWVPVEKRKNYFPQVWNTDAVRDKPQDVIALLLKHNMKELTAIAANANAEVAAKRKMPIGTVSRARLADESTHTITETEIAEAIVARLLQAGGYVDHDETTSDLGISPVATSVNRRSLDFVRHPDFDEFKSHDMTSIMTSYVASMVKRAEYTKHFGPGGETLRDKFDAAVLEEIGGDKLVRAALKEHGKMLAEYLSRQQDAVAANERFRERRPSLRVIGLELHTKEVGKDKVEVAHQKAVKDLEQAAKAIMAMEGTLGSDISPATRQVVSAITAYQTVRLLPTVLFSSINDVMGIVARGGELGDAWKALVRGMREVRLRWNDEKSTDSAAMRAEEWGTVEAGSQMEVLGQIYGSMYMTGAARRLSNSFFKWNGMEGWNRAMRIEASVIAERALTALAKHGYNKDDPAAVARVEALYGKGFDTANIKLDGNGRLDSSDEANQAAMMHWVQSAIMTPNASHRTIWGSDPRMAPFWHLKQFAYTFHRVMLKGAFEQAKLGNYRPAMVLALGYAPVTIAAGAVKEMLIPGDEPPWMKGGLDDYLSYGVSRAGIFGIPGMTYSSISDDYGVNMLGPTVSQVVNATTDAPVETGLRALPLGTLLGRAAPAQ